jgi:two-component system CheB/CheR fusion protein
MSRIKEKGGVTLVQNPGDAEHDGMPDGGHHDRRGRLRPAGGRDAAEADRAVGERQRASNCRRRATAKGRSPTREVRRAPTPRKPCSASSASCACHTGHDFRQYKRATVLRRIERRMQVRRAFAARIPASCSRRRARIQALLDDMLIGVTNFFRDREAFEALERDVIPELFKRQGPGDEVRAWVAACSTGEEAYSLAMLLADQTPRRWRPPPSFQVFASDIDERAIAPARRRVSGLDRHRRPPARLRQHFTKDDDRYRIRKAMRDRILFAAHNLLRDPPFSRST